MACRSCGSEAQEACEGEMRIPLTNNVAKFVSMRVQMVTVCLKCGFTEFQIEKSDLDLLRADLDSPSS